MIDAGSLDKRVTFLVPQVGTDEAGGDLPYIEGKPIWAAINLVSGRDPFSAGAFASQATHKITMRYRAGIQPNWQVKYRQRIFNIIYPNNLNERNEQLDLYCVEINGVT
jgi:SPP1 family predicted phage head-tail adaptor